MPPSNKPKAPTFGRCTFHTLTGRRCRSLIIFPDGRFCLRHIHTQSSEDDVSLSLTDRALDFRHPRGIHNSLRNLYLQLATGQISSRRASTLAYIANALMRHLPVSQQPDPTACHCVGFPHFPHADYPAPAPKMSDAGEKTTLGKIPEISSEIG